MDNNKKVVVRQIPCLSYNDEEEKYDMRKAFIGDIVNIFLNDDSKVDDCKIMEFGADSVAVEIEGRLQYILYSSITGFNIRFRGDYTSNISRR